MEKEEKIKKLALEVFNLARNTILVNFRFLDAAINEVKLIPNNDFTLLTNGEYFSYNPIYVLQEYKKEREKIQHDYLHMLIHCIFRHMYVHTMVDQDLWNLSCDIATEKMIIDLNMKSFLTSRTEEKIKEISNLESKKVMITAEKIYHYYLEHRPKDLEIERLFDLFASDEHKIWYLPPEQQYAMLGIKVPSKMKGDGTGDEDGESEGENGKKIVYLHNDGLNGENEGNGSGNPIEYDSEGNLHVHLNMSEGRWKELAERIQEDMETFGKQRGYGSGSMIQNLKEVNREKYDYTSFLKKFAVMGEAMKINDDEFDYVYYTYGLKLYDKMPLIEPLEYKDVKRIKEFVIAIDTSGSVMGEQVQSFIQKTYNILKSTESFFSKINLHIIQCDAVIHEDVKITNQEEFDMYLKNMTLKGFGGTDFRPVFDHVDSLIEQKEFTNLKGLIYFTDGYGTFPRSKPNYETAFVFVRDNYEIPEVPVWAIKLILEREDL